MKKQVFLVLVLVGMLAACSKAEPSIQSTPSLTLAVGSTPTQTSTPRSNLTPSSPPVTAFTPTSPGISTPSSELLPCPSPKLPQTESAQPMEILYVNENQIWLWDEASQEKTQVGLPPGAVAPQISTDGRFAAYLIEGQSYDSLESPRQEIPLWLYDRQNGQAKQVASFDTSKTRREYPESPHITLQMRWLESNLGLPEDHWLLVEVHWEPWAEAGCCVPRGDLYLVKAETGETERILGAGSYYFYNVSPDGRQIAALDMDGRLYLIDIPPADQEKPLSVRLPANPWLVFAPVYSPDGAHMVLQVDKGLAVVDVNSRSIQELALENPCEGCYWGPRLPVNWQPEGRGFFTTTSLNDYFNPRAETTLVQVKLEAELKPETVAVIHANPFTFDFSSDYRYLSYWNQPDLDEIDAGTGEANWVSLYLMDLQGLQPIRYVEEFGLRLDSWSPDNQHFLYIYSPFGGPNLDRRMLSLGNVCQPPKELPVPAGSIIDATQWVDSSHFLVWTLPAEGISDSYPSGLYLYPLEAENLPIHIDDIVIDHAEPYGSQRQVVVLKH